MTDAPNFAMNGTNIILRLNWRIKNIKIRLKYQWNFPFYGTKPPDIGEKSLL